jgi:transcriptional regulator with XRE-family HTH domain
MIDLFGLGATLKKLREKQNESMRQAGEAVGLSQAYIALLETGQRNPTVDVLNRLVAHYGHEFDLQVRRKGAKAPVKSSPSPEEQEDAQFMAQLAALLPRVRDPVERKVLLRDLEKAAEREAERADTRAAQG